MSMTCPRCGIVSKPGPCPTCLTKSFTNAGVRQAMQTELLQEINDSSLMDFMGYLVVKDETLVRHRLHQWKKQPRILSEG